MMNHLFQWIEANEALARLGSFITIGVIMASLEFLFPRRNLQLPRTFRWLHNFSLVFLTTALMRGIFWVPPAAFAYLISEKQWGLLHQVSLPFFLQVGISVLFLDFVIYWQHVIFHRVGWLWRLHRMHHADVDYDFTLGSKFHPLEIFLSFLIKFGAILVLGPPAVAVILFEVILNGMAVFNHANVKLPLSLDRFLRWIFVTPDFHRVHHSSDPRETHQNYGFNLSVWDRIFKTYTPQPRQGHEVMEIGLKIFREKKYQTLWGLLRIPFVKR